MSNSIIFLVQRILLDAMSNTLQAAIIVVLAIGAARWCWTVIRLYRQDY